MIIKKIEEEEEKKKKKLDEVVCYLLYDRYKSPRPLALKYK